MLRKSVWVLVLACLFFSPFAAQAEITQLVITTDPQNIGQGTTSAPITVQLQDSAGAAQTAGEKIYVKFDSTSGTGKFSTSATNWQDCTSTYMSSSWKNRTFYYRDSTLGTYTITVSAEDKPWSPATQNIIVSETGAPVNNTNSGTSTANDDADSSNNDDTDPDSTPVPVISSGGSGISTTDSPVSVASVKENFSRLGAGRERLGTIGTPIVFQAWKDKKSATLPMRFTWSFGDGTKADGENVSHSYLFAGTYNVVLNGYFTGGQAVSRTLVHILQPNLSFKIVDDGGRGFEIGNQNKDEINLGNWSIADNSSSFQISPDTIIGGQSKIVIPLAATNLAATSTVKLINPAGNWALASVSALPHLSLADSSLRQKQIAELEQKWRVLKNLVAARSIKFKSVREKAPLTLDNAKEETDDATRTIIATSSTIVLAEKRTGSFFSWPERGFQFVKNLFAR